MDVRDVVMESYNFTPQDDGIHNFMCFVIKVINDLTAEFLLRKSHGNTHYNGKFERYFIALRSIVFNLKLKYNLNFALC